MSFVIRKMKLVSFSLFLDPPPRLEMPFTYVVNVYSDMSLSKGHLGSRGGGGETSKNKLKDTIFIFPMTNVTILGVFVRMRRRDTERFGKLRAFLSLTFKHFYFFITSNAFTQSLV